MKCKGIFQIIAASLFIALFSSLALAKVVAQVDRTRLAMDETLTLTITKDSNSFFSSDPDLSPLTKDFTLLGQSQSSNTQYINGTKTASVTWTVALAPKHTGGVVLPSLTVDKERTQPISMQIVQAAPPLNRDDGAPIFVESSLDCQSVLVQSQLILTVRIYWAVQAQINDPGDPVLEDALLQKLGDATFKKDINGQQYSVFERRYAIFPQKSGVLKIPSITVDAMLPMPRRRNFYDPFGNQGKRIKLRSNSAQVTVMEKPPSYPAQAAWLPADNLTVKVQWSQEPQDLKVGESTTITITTTAQGLMAAQLPPIAIAEVNKIKLYQNKAENADNKDAGGITGVRKETIALIPTQAGEIQLPEIRIPWWDKQQQKVRYAISPATRLAIHGTGAARNNSPPALAKPQAPLLAANNQDIAPVGPQAAPLFWVILCGSLAIAWLTTTLFLIRTRKRIAGLNATAPLTQLDSGNKAAIGGEEAYQQLKNACQANNGTAAKAAFMAWTKAAGPQPRLYAETDLKRIDDELAPLLAELDRYLYGRQGTEQWHGDKLWDLVRKRRSADKKNGKKKKAALPSLFNN